MRGLMKVVAGFALLGLFFVLAACSEDDSPEATSNESGGDKINVVTTITQIGEPMSVIGGDRVNVESLMGPSVDPHIYNPTQSDISKINEADVIFYSGLDLEANMVEIFKSIGESKPVLALGDTVPENDILTDENGAVDPHVWFDIDLWQNGLDKAVEVLKEYSPEDADYFEENKQQYFAELEELKEETEKLSDIPESHRVLVTAHDAFGYFGRMHDLEVIGLQGLSTEDEIGVSDINDTIVLIKKYQVPAIFVESTINQKSIQAVIEGALSEGVNVELGGELFSDAMGKPGAEEGTYIGMYRHNINTIHDALSGGGE